MRLSVKNGFGLLLIALCLQACNLLKNKDPLCASWKLVNNEWGGKADSALNKEFQYAYLRLYPDSQYSFISPVRSIFGVWTFNPKDSVLTVMGFYRYSDLVFHVKTADGEWMRGTILPTNSFPFLLKADPGLEHKDIDLLSRTSNEWRIKPRHKETKEQIRIRVLAHVEYMRQYFKIVEEDGRPGFQTGFMHTPIQYYQNGIGIKEDDRIPTGWYDAFYDDDDAKTGLNLLGASIQSMNGYPKNTKTYTEGYYKALGEMKKYLEMIK